MMGGENGKQRGDDAPPPGDGPEAAVRRGSAAPLPKRFYKTASVEARDGGFALLLDGRGVKTPGKRALVLPTRAFADAVAEEWMAQGERVDPTTMPLTRIANTAIDAVAENMDAVAADIVAFAGSDLLCYRATAPEGLVTRQSEAWDPLLAWAKDELGAPLETVAGVMPVVQRTEALAGVASALEELGPFALAALHVMTTLAGSAVIGLAHARGRLPLEEAWASAHVDEDWQIEQWGEDAEAAARRVRRRAEFAAASRAFFLATET